MLNLLNLYWPPQYNFNKFNKFNKFLKVVKVVAVILDRRQKPAVRRPHRFSLAGRLAHKANPPPTRAPLLDP